MRIVLYNFAALHYELHLFQRGDIFQRVAIDGDEVGLLAGFERADLGGPSQQVGRVDGGGLDGLQRRHAEADVDSELVGVEAVRIDGSVGSKRNFTPAAKAFFALACPTAETISILRTM